MPGNQKQAVAWAALLSDFPLLFLTRFCFALSRLSFSLFNLSQFDEPTQPEVTMTESHTPGGHSCTRAIAREKTSLTTTPGP